MKQLASDNRVERKRAKVPRGNFDPVIIIYDTIFRSYKRQSRIGINAVQFSCLNIATQSEGILT